ncbi:MAG TPA: M48 family metalloprotease [Myxococcota bacterium]|nr:M48 family metalloprotease [Myxococcota bacterium]HRY93470.1 M48 family metalloprotease [Myxococcota bacterium]HSA23360.1 M48 family metalloprotease [Myxococcota bacterium]
MPGFDPSRYFSVAELAHWAAQRRMDDLLELTWLGLKLLILGVVLWGGLHLALRGAGERAAAWLYTRPGLQRLGARAPLLRRLVAVPERLAGRDQPRQWIVDALFPVLFLLVWTALVVPLSYFDTYVLGHERGLVTMGPGRFWADVGLALAMNSVFYALLGLGLFGLARRLPRTWWLWLWGAVVGMLAVWNLMAPYEARVFHDFTPLQEGPLKGEIARVVRGAGLELEQVQVVDTSTRSRHATAYLMGEGPTRRVVLGDNLLHTFHPREIVVAVAHEVGHELQAHPLRTWLTTALAALLFLALVRLVLWRAPRLGRLGLRPGADPAVLPLLLLILQLLFLANQPLSAWLDRREEAAADDQALQLTRDPEAFASLMVRLARTNQADIAPPALVHWFWHHHPTLAERIRAAAAWATAAGADFSPERVPLPGPAPAAGG